MSTADADRNKVRLNKLIADSGLASRRAADRLIEDGHVTVNGKRAFTVAMGPAMFAGELAAVHARLASLSTREREVLDLILAGKMNKVVADKLGIDLVWFGVLLAVDGRDGRRRQAARDETWGRESAGSGPEPVAEEPPADEAVASRQRLAARRHLIDKAQRAPVGRGDAAAGQDHSHRMLHAYLTR